MAWRVVLEPRHMYISVKFSDDLDLLYVHLREGTIEKTLTFGDHRLVDVDEDGRVIGAEFIGLAEGIDLRGLPEQQRLAMALSKPDTHYLAVLSDMTTV